MERQETQIIPLTVPTDPKLSSQDEFGQTPPTMTRPSGEPIGNYRTVKTVGPKGPVLMEDHVFLEDMQHMARGRIPERAVHAKGTGAHGYFEVTNDITKYCAAKLFSEVGKRTKLFARFSVSITSLGSADTNRGPRGAGFKMYTEEGNWDLTVLNEPVFPVNSPMKIVSMANSVERNPQSNLPDANARWDWFSYNPEGTHFQLLNFSDRGIPDGYRYLNMWGISTFTLVNQHGESVYTRFFVRSDLGFRALDPVRAVQLAGSNPDYASQDLSDAITRGDYPSYTLLIQVMTLQEAKDLRYDPFDNTKVWSQKKFNPIPVGKIVLTANTANHWDESEQAAFCPVNLVPGIRPSPDKVLADRMFVYQDTQVYRLGVNHNQLPINSPICPVANYLREGRGVYVSQGSAPVYFPNSFGGPVESQRAAELEPSYRVCGEVGRYEDEDDHFWQPRDFWKNVIDAPHRRRLAANIAQSLRTASRPVQRRVIEIFSKVDPEVGLFIQQALNTLEESK